MIETLHFSLLFIAMPEKAFYNMNIYKFDKNYYKDELRKEIVVERESKQSEKMEWSAPVLITISVDATESGATETESESEYEFPFS
ncbi:MAG: hypothetical protein VB070_05815 [Clostridiaceae bacterium]|nr:hypothetical protein [Clostridiaceae bacterium]